MIARKVLWVVPWLAAAVLAVVTLDLINGPLIALNRKMFRSRREERILRRNRRWMLDARKASR